MTPAEISTRALLDTLAEGNGDAGPLTFGGVLAGMALRDPDGSAIGLLAAYLLCKRGN